jgi:hypothetical protein
MADGTGRIAIVGRPRSRPRASVIVHLRGREDVEADVLVGPTRCGR